MNGATGQVYSDVDCDSVDERASRRGDPGIGIRYVQRWENLRAPEPRGAPFQHDLEIGYSPVHMQFEMGEASGCVVPG